MRPDIDLAVMVIFQKLLYIITLSTRSEFCIVGNPPIEYPQVAKKTGLNIYFII